MEYYKIKLYKMYSYIIRYVTNSTLQLVTYCKL